MEDLNNHLLFDRICPITGLEILPILPEDSLYWVGYIIPGINKDCLIRISARVLMDKEIISLLQRFKKQFGLNLLMNENAEVIITTENYLAFVAQFSKN
jgi:hypothetical protein